MLKSPRQKGNRFEREVAKILSNEFNIQVRRTPMSGAIGDDLSGDLRVLSDSFLKKFHFELKKRKSIIFTKWYKKARGEANQFIPSKIPVIIVGIDFEENYAILSLDTFIKLLKEANPVL